MCGIAGFFAPARSSWRADSATLAYEMGNALVYRGPDAGTVWCDEQVGIALSHRRLAIVDLSPTGAQPMTSHCGRWVLCYNGEIYNFPELREALEAKGVTFKGSSDTELIVESIAAKGLTATLEDLAGMFAFALWDKKERQLSLVRDRLGIKPLYIAQTPLGLAFGSEPKALLALPGFDTSLNPAAIASLLQHYYIGGELCIYANTRKLKPGYMLQLSVDELEQGHWSPPKAWWHLDKCRNLAMFDGSAEQATVALEELLSHVVGQHMMADVPLGAFLSGGVDSSAVVALMQRQSNQPVQTYSIGFEDQAYNEAAYAKAVAEYLGTKHTELYVTAQDALDVVPLLANMYAEPFADSSQIPTYMVSKLARSDVTVSLSGDGGDELFCGYSRYYADDCVPKSMSGIPRQLRQSLGWAIKMLSIEAWDTLGRSLLVKQVGAKAHSLAEMLSHDADAAYRQMISVWPLDRVPVLGDWALADLSWPSPSSKTFANHQQWRQYMDTLTYLPDDILTKVDRASMAVSLEARVPLLDHRVLEFAWQLQHALQTGPTEAVQHAKEPSGKWLLRQVLYRHVPRELIDRPKRGFGVPLGQWLSGPLRDWSEELLSLNALKSSGLFDVKVIRQKWEYHLSGQGDWQAALWPVLMFQAWNMKP